MSYVDAFLEREKDRINVVERIDGKRYYKTYPTRYTFYYADPGGKYKSIFNLPLSRFSTKSRTEFDKEKKSFSHQKLYESDINPIFRCLEENYLDSKSPKLHICFFDIEVDFEGSANSSFYNFNASTESTCCGANLSKKFGPGNAEGNPDKATTDGTIVNKTKTNMFGFHPHTQPSFAVMNVANLSSKEKLGVIHAIGHDSNSSGSGVAPDRSEMVAKYSNTSDPISSIQQVTSWSTYNSGSEMVVLGWDPSDKISVELGGVQTYEIDGEGTKWAPEKGTVRYNKDAFIVIKNQSRRT